MIDISQERDRQRFIDGELSIDEENDALIQCEINPDLWRTLAVAMVEQRRLAAALSPVNQDIKPIALTAAEANADGANAAASGVGSPKSRWISWRTAASIAALIGCSVGAFAIGHKEGTASSIARQKSGPVIVQVQYPEKPSVDDSSLASMSRNIFNPEAQAIFAEAGYRVDEKLQWEIVNEGDSYIAVPNREVRFVSMQP